MEITLQVVESLYNKKLITYYQYERYKVRIEVIKAHNEGMRPKDIVKKFSISRASYYRYVKEL